MSLTLTIRKLRFPNNGSISNPITVSLYIKPFYDLNFTLIDSGVNVDVDGTILDSPLPTTTVDPTEKYVLKAVNELCGFEYEQNLIINPYCPVGYELAPDSSYCFYEETTDATPPTAGENTVAAPDIVYTMCGSYIYDIGYNVNGTGSSTQISLANAFWRNGSGTCVVDGNTNDGPLNRTALWATSTMSNQTVGFAVCVDIPEEKTYYVGMGADNLGIINLNGVNILTQDPTALDVQYPFVGAAAVPFRIWHIYPVTIPAGLNIIELIGYNDSGVAAMGMEVYNNTAAEIAAATGYGDLNMIFTSTDYIGQPVVLGSDGLGYSCAPGYSLKTCDSPIVCSKIITTPVLY